MSTDELFDPASVAMDSPRLAWMKRHGISVFCYDWTGTDFEGTDEPRYEGQSKKAFAIQGPSCKHPVVWTNRGPRCDTEDQAIEAIAKEIGIKLWNEEDGA
jgi:hypothetical protein